jgi:membrane protease YdiL (CAAX protease family)
MKTDITPSQTVQRDVTTPSGVDWIGITCYIVLAFGISWAIWITLSALGVAFLTRTALGMFGPALACLLVRLIRREGFSDTRLRLVGRRAQRAGLLYLAGYVVPLVLIALGVGIALLVGVQQGILPASVRSVPVSVAIMGALTPGVLITMVFTFGEELGWRGYLLPRLSALGGPAAATLVGIIWGLWHAPVIWIGYDYNDPHSLVPVFMFVLVTVPLSIIFAWLRFRSGSIWPTTLAHAVGNQAASLALIAFVTPGNLYLGAPIGVIGILPFAAFAIWLMATGRVKPESTK